MHALKTTTSINERIGHAFNDGCIVLICSIVLITLNAPWWSNAHDETDHEHQHATSLNKLLYYLHVFDCLEFFVFVGTSADYCRIVQALCIARKPLRLCVLCAWPVVIQLQNSGLHVDILCDSMHDDSTKLSIDQTFHVYASS